MVTHAQANHSVLRAMHDPDHFVIVFEYEDRRGKRTRRVVSPIRFASRESFLALCLSREEPRRFDLARCRNVQLAPAHEYAMPVELESLGQPPAASASY